MKQNSSNIHSSQTPFCLAIIVYVLLSQLFAIPPSWALDDQTLTVSCPQKCWPPYLITDDPEHPYSGIMFDVLREIATTSNFHVVIKFYPEKRGLMYLDRGVVDAYPKAMEWMPHPENYLWTDPIVNSEDILVTLQSDNYTFESIEDLFGKDVAMVHGFTYPTLEPHFQNGVINRHVAQNTETILRLVQVGRVDGALTNRQVAEWVTSNSQILDRQQLRFSKATVDSAPYRFAFNNTPKWRRFILNFNVELQRMKTDGHLDAILKRYK